MSFGFFDALKLLGALGLFIFGMKIMSEGIQKFAGSRLRDILGSFTSNRFKGILTGFFTTTLIQSSSATTVMIVSFVNAGLLKLRQAIGVIMGANIGTTMTAWLLLLFGFSKGFSIGSYAYPVLAVGVPLLFVRRDRVRSLGEFLVGFSILFIGLGEMKDVVEGLNLDQNENFINFINGLASGGFFSILLFVLIGTVLTITVQSSSAAMALTITFCGSGLPFELAAAIVLGENIGTTITANLAAIVGNVHAKRAARAHFIFNVFGVLWMLIAFYGVTQLIDSYMSGTQWGSPMDTNNPSSIRYSLAMFHTTFNIINTLLLVWFVKLIENTVIKIVPSKGIDDEVFRLEFIDSNLPSTAEISISQARKEVYKFSEIIQRMANRFNSLLTEKDKRQQRQLMDRVYHYEEITDRIEYEVGQFLTRLSEEDLTGESSKKVRKMLSAVTDMERIGDIYYEMTKMFEKKIEEKIWFTQEQRNNLVQFSEKVIKALEIMNHNLNINEKETELQAAINMEEEINQYRDQLRNDHYKNVEKGEYKLESGAIYSNIFSSLERVGDHALNVNEAIFGINIV